MASHTQDRGGLQDKDTTLERILTLLQKQESRKDDDSLLLMTIASKLDIQGQQLKVVEEEVKRNNVKLEDQQRELRNVNKTQGSRSKVGSHTVRSVYCYIKLFVLVAHTSHFMQPLDVGCFRYSIDYIFKKNRSIK